MQKYITPLVQPDVMKDAHRNVVQSRSVAPWTTQSPTNQSVATFQDIRMGGPQLGTHDQSDQLAQALASATKSEDSSADTNVSHVGSESTAVSDERMKELFGEAGASLVDCMAHLNAYAFKYTPEAQQQYGVDNNKHIGVMAQELEANPALGPDVVKELADGTKVVDTKELTMNLAAIMSEMAKRIVALEEHINGKN